MTRFLKLAAATLAAPALALAQPPAPMPTGVPPVVAVPAVPTAPTAAPPAAITPYTPPTEEVTADPAAEPAEEPETKYLVENLLGRTAGGQQLLDNGWRIYGWTQLSATTGSTRNTTLPVPFIDRIEKLSLNQNWLHVEKTVDTSKKELQIGGAADLILPGSDARFSISRGLLDNQAGRTHPIDLFQAYVDVFAPNVGPEGTTFRGGKFQTLVGYETVQGISTPFLSRSYNFQYNPFTHTGVQAITPLNDDWTVTNGVVMGSDNFFSDAQRVTYIGQVKYAPKCGSSTLALNAVVTDPRFDVANNYAFYNVYNLVYTNELTDGLTYAADATFSHIDNVPGLGSAHWYGLANYLLYDVSCKLQAKTRVELFMDEKGFRTGTEGLYTAVTTGLTWKPTPWLWVMPEVRYDHANRGTPFEGDNDMFTATLGGIVRW